MNWPKDLKVKVKQPLRGKTHFRIGGPAQFFSQPEDPLGLSAVISMAKKNKIPVFILGAGSNLLISDKGVKGLVISLSSPYFKRICLRDGCIEAGSAGTLGELIKFAQAKSLQGLEFLAGIPATLGGALAMNAGCWRGNIGNLVKEAEVMDYSGNIKILNSKDIKFAYRKSSLAKYIILSAVLKLKKGSRPQIVSKINRYLTVRRNTQDLTWPNAGCIFKNPKRAPAGKLIDLCGLKGSSIGAAFVSERHANFILNKGGANAKDVLRLMRSIVKQVRDKFRLTLQPEIKIWR